MIQSTHAIRCEVQFHALTPLMIHSGRSGDFSDSAIEKDESGRLHINGYVWASLLRRAVSRLDQGVSFSRLWGKFPSGTLSVSPLWTEATFIENKDYDVVINPGNRINREWGSVEEGAFFNEEVAIPLAPITLRFILFCSSAEDTAEMRVVLRGLLSVIGEGIETIGGGWAYGFGRLKPVLTLLSALDLRIEQGRSALWDLDFNDWQFRFNEMEIQETNPKIDAASGWTCIDVDAGVADGQLLAIHSTLPPLTQEMPKDLPDRFVFTRTKINHASIETVPVITGKAFRQAVLSREIERKLRSTGDKACLNTSDEKRTPAITANPTSSRHCLCKRCLWFGDTKDAGIVSVGDAEISDQERSWSTLHRIQLCEHSLQNIQLFSGEYLTGGRFKIRILIDHARKKDCSPQTAMDCVKAINSLLTEMEPENGPPGWYRLGATTSNTGQLTVHRFTKSSTGGAE